MNSKTINILLTTLALCLWSFFAFSQDDKKTRDRGRLPVAECSDTEVLNGFCAYSVKGEFLFDVQKHKCFQDGKYLGSTWYNTITDEEIDPSEYIIKICDGSDCKIIPQQYCHDTDCDGNGDELFTYELKICTDGEGNETRESNAYSDYGTDDEAEFNITGDFFPCPNGLAEPCVSVCMTCSNYAGTVKPVKGVIKVFTVIKKRTSESVQAKMEECEPEPTKCKKGDKLELVICGESITEAYLNGDLQELPIDSSNFERIDDCDLEISDEPCDFDIERDRICAIVEGVECTLDVQYSYCDGEPLDTTITYLDNPVESYIRIDCHKCEQRIGCLDFRLAVASSVTLKDGTIIQIPSPGKQQDIIDAVTAECDGTGEYILGEISKWAICRNVNIGEFVFRGSSCEIDFLTTQFGDYQSKSFGNCNFQKCCPVVDDCQGQSYLLITKCEINGRPCGLENTYAGIVQVGDILTGVHPTLGNNITGWNAYELCAESLPAPDGNNAIWLSGSVSDYSDYTYTPVDPSPNCCEDEISFSSASIPCPCFIGSISATGIITSQHPDSKCTPAVSRSNGSGNNQGLGNRYTLTFPAGCISSDLVVTVTPIGPATPNGGIDHIWSKTANTVTIVFNSGDDAQGEDEFDPFPFDVKVEGCKINVLTGVE